MGRFGSSCTAETAVLFDAFWNKHNSSFTHHNVVASTSHAANIQGEHEILINLTDKAAFRVFFRIAKEYSAIMKLEVIDQSAMDEYTSRENIEFTSTQEKGAITVSFVDEEIHVAWKYQLVWKDDGSSDEDMEEDTPQIYSSLSTIVAERYDLEGLWKAV